MLVKVRATGKDREEIIEADVEASAAASST